MRTSPRGGWFCEAHSIGSFRQGLPASIEFVGRWPEAQATRLGGHDGAGRQFIAMSCNRGKAGMRLEPHGESHQPDDTRMFQTESDGQFPEILVERNHHARLFQGESKDLFVARIGRPIARPDDIVAGSGKLVRRPFPNA